MKRLIVAGVFFLANVAGPAMATDCTASSSTNLTSDAISALLVPGGTFPSRVYACYNDGTKRVNNERLFSRGPGGNVEDYKLGPTDPNDKSAIVGKYAGSPTPTDTITYIYGTTSYVYYICANPSGNTYKWVNQATGAILNVVVSTSVSGCAP